ncbi:MAG: hypothetical protein Q7J29_07670 [Stagnimonas sp.]|nr:hypothetical protein [Stagnimonas sp.]
MTRLKTLLIAFAFPFTVLAADPVVVLQNPQARGDSSFSYRQEFTATCGAPSVGDCSSCTVSCPVGAAATCKPGKVSAAMGDGTCQREPSCTCVSSAPTAKK